MKKNNDYRLVTASFIVFFLFTWPVLLAIGPAGAAAAESAVPGYSHYELTVKLDIVRHTIGGTVKVTYRNRGRKPLSVIYFRLPANLGREKNPYLNPLWNDEGYPQGFDPTWTEVTAARDAQGRPLSFDYEPALPVSQTYSLARGFLRVTLPEPLAPGASYTLSLDFITKFAQRQGDEGYFNDTYTWRFGWYPIERELVGDRWDEGQRDPVATYELTLTVPRGYTALVGADEQVSLEGTGEVTFLARDRTPRRSLPLVISPRYQLATGEYNGVKIYSYYLPNHGRVGQLLPELAERILGDYEEHYGPYPYRRVIIAENENPGAGMSADGMVLLPTLVYKYWDLLLPGLYDRLLEGLLAHELAHHWWGIGIGADFDAENWLSEGFAEYLAVSYFERRYGSEGSNVFADPLLADLIAYVEGEFNYRELEEWGYLDAVKLGMDEAIIKPLRKVKYFNTQTTRLYQKGYLVLRALEGTIGREKMEAVLRTAAARYQGREAMSVADFARLAAEVSGRDLTAFFQDWLYTDGTQFDAAVLSLRSEPVAEGFRTQVEVRREGKAGPQTLTLRLTGSDGVVYDERWEGTKARETLIFTTPQRIVRAELDPQRLFLDTNRLNNAYPRKVKWTMANVRSLDTKIYRYYPGIIPESLLGGDPTSLQLGFGLGARVRNDYSWDLYQCYYTDGYLSDGYIPLRGGQFTWNPGRSLTLQGYFAQELINNTGGGEATLTWTGWRPVALGTPATYWHPTHTVTVGVGTRALGIAGIGGGYQDPYWQVSYSRDDSLRLAMANTLNVMGFSRPGAGKAWWEGITVQRLRPNLLLLLTGEFGVSRGLRIGGESYAYALDLASFPQETGDFGSSLQASLAFPLQRGREGHLLYGSLYEGLEARLYLNAAAVWDEPLQARQAWKAEIGGEVTLNFKTIDLFGTPQPFGLSVGFVRPLWQAAPGPLPAGGELYFRFSLPLVSSFLGL